MKNIKETLKGLAAKLTFIPDSFISDRREKILSQPIEPNGSVFEDSWSAQEYSVRLKREGYSVVEGTQNGMPFVRPQTRTERESVNLFFEQNQPNAMGLAAILDEVGRRAKAGELTEADLYRQPPRH